MRYSLDYEYLDSHGYRENNYVRRYNINPRFEFLGNNFHLEAYTSIQEYDGQVPGSIPLDFYKSDPEDSYQKGSYVDLTFVNLGLKT